MNASQTEFDNHLAKLFEGTSVTSSLQYFCDYFTSLVSDELPWGVINLSLPAQQNSGYRGLHLPINIEDQVNTNINYFISLLSTLLSEETDSESSALLFQTLLAIAKIQFGANALLEKVDILVIK